MLSTHTPTSTLLLKSDLGVSYRHFEDSRPLGEGDPCALLVRRGAARRHVPDSFRPYGTIPQVQRIERDCEIGAWNHLCLRAWLPSSLYWRCSALVGLFSRLWVRINHQET